MSLFVALSGTSYAVANLPARSVGTKQLKPNAVTSGKVKDNALTGAEVNEATLGQVPSAASAASATSAATASSVVPNAIGGAQVADRSLTTNDIAIAAGSTMIDAPSLGPNSCAVIPVYVGVDMANDPVLVIPSDSFAPNLSVSAADDSQPDSFITKICNYDPVTFDAPADEFYWVVFDMP